MSISTRNFVFGLAVLSGISASSVVLAAPAEAFSLHLDSNGHIESVTFDETDQEGASFTVEFNGNVNGTSVDWLSAKATFTFLGFRYLSTKNVTEVGFIVELENTTTNAVVNGTTYSTTSRVSALAFDTDLQLIDASGRAEDQSGDTRVSKVYTNNVFTQDKENGQLPNGFGSVDVCFLAGNQGNSCSGGGSGGVQKGSSGTFVPILAFSGRRSSVTLSNFGVRYQSINGPGLAKDDSGTSVIVAPGGSKDWADIEESKYW